MVYHPENYIAHPASPFNNPLIFTGMTNVLPTHSHPTALPKGTPPSNQRIVTLPPLAIALVPLTALFPTQRNTAPLPKTNTA
jgi:hypothetical protein